ncbi:unnamed protein product [Zymoseptoria tritici ST99CH_1E4]|uniref:Uncharacterized protein n=1 Tax=Zymoseptoria tritici ST99CH_1E4 TaxID=1276532 RepID=A0A2H1HA26_ZYMTR|nr:unnamed protein product [Zymoseptoria tritici ST99CH_1E4]
MVFQGKITIPLSWCDASTLSSKHRTLGYAIINDPSGDDHLLEPQLLPSKLYHPILANLNLGFYAGQATTRDGCPSVIDWKTASKLTAAIRAWAATHHVAKECSPLPAQLYELMSTLDVPVEFGAAIVSDVLVRVLRFVSNHVSVPALKDVGRDRPGLTKTVNLTVAMLARMGSFDHPASIPTASTYKPVAIAIPPPRLVTPTPESRHTTSTTAPYMEEVEEEVEVEHHSGRADERKRSDLENAYTTNASMSRSSSSASPSTSSKTVPSGHVHSNDNVSKKQPDTHMHHHSTAKPTTHAATNTTTVKSKPSSTTKNMPINSTEEDVHSVVAALVAKYNHALPTLYRSVEQHQKHLHLHASAINQAERNLEHLSQRVNVVEGTRSFRSDSRWPS